MKVERQNLWPTTVYSFKIDDRNIHNDKLYFDILKRESQGLGFKFNPVQGSGWQSNKELFESSDVFSNLKKSLIVNVNNILSDVYNEDAEIRMINNWANLSRMGEYTMPHIHEEASWSCVYYVTETDDARLYFKDPRLQEAMDSSHHFKKIPYTNHISKRPFESGEAILFPSWLEHGVSPSLTDSIRISIACNFLIGASNGN